MNKLLRRQIRRKFGEMEQLPTSLQELLQAVSDSYDRYERDRKLIERAMDISSKELRESYEKLAVQADLQRANKELQQFVHIASHDLKAPIRTILSFCQLLERAAPKENFSPQSEEYLKFIKDGAVHMNNLLTDLLDYATLGKESLKEEPVDLNKIVSAVKRHLAASLEKYGATINASSLPTICGYPSQILQLFQNIISNGIKFTKDKAPIITIQAEVQDKDFYITIQDNGIGIPPEQQEKIFELFHRMNNTHAYEGTGIGLSICKRIVENLEGRIWVSSEPGEGATFHISIPKSRCAKYQQIAAVSNA